MVRLPASSPVVETPAKEALRRSNGKIDQRRRSSRLTTYEGKGLSCIDLVNMSGSPI